MRSRESYGVLLSNLRSTAGLSQETLARCVESSKSALSRLENGDAQLPFRGSVRKLVLRLAELLCTSRKETERYLHVAGIDMTLLTEREEFQLGFAPNLDTEASQESATLQRWESIYQQLIQRLQECEKRLVDGNVPSQIGMKIQDYKYSLQKIQLKLNISNERNLELKAQLTNLKAKPLPPLESSDCFSFGNFQLSWLVLDGEGTESYLPANVRTHYDPHPEQLLGEIEQEREQIQKEQEENKRNGKPFQWNGDMYHLTHFLRSREAIHENMTLDLWFKPTNYYAFLAKNKCLEESHFSEKYVLGHDWETPMSGIASTVAVCLTLVTSDGYTIFTQRGRDVGIRPGFFTTSVSEALSRPLDRSTTSQAPDVYRCACRGLAEELGIYEPADFSSSDIYLLSFGLETRYIQWNLCGGIKIQKTAAEVLRNWQVGVKDKMENKKLYAIPFTPKDVCSFVFSREPWAPGGLVCLYHALVHEFGREEVERVLSSY